MGETVPNQEILVSHLCRNDSAKWNNVFLWFVENRFELIDNKSTNKVFLKALMLAIAKNVDVTLTDWYGNFPLMLAVTFDDKDSILTLIKRDANVNQDKYGWTTVHEAAYHGNIDACATLLENDANIDAANHTGWTPLMTAAINGKRNVYKFLITKGADEIRTNNFGETAAQLANFQQR